MDVGQPEVRARVSVREPGVFQPHDSRDRGAEVVDGILRDLFARVVGSTEADSMGGQEAGKPVTALLIAGPTFVIVWIAGAWPSIVGTHRTGCLSTRRRIERCDDICDVKDGS
jgi:hypothetical protein